jgi:hypothetical protein
VELFPSDSEDSDGGSQKEKTRKRGKRGGKGKKIKDESGPVEDDGEQDIVEDWKASDWS